MTWEDILKRMTLADVLDREMKSGDLFGSLFNTYKRMCKEGKDHVRSVLTDSVDRNTGIDAVGFGVLDSRAFDELYGGLNFLENPKLVKELGTKIKRAIGEGARKCADSKKPKTPEVEPPKTGFGYSYNTQEEYDELERRVKLGLEDPSVLDL